ncbi:MAG: hypothetical protein KA792_04775 [Bacteroidales bacterium]|nr:hypothetical protein [Bacteroidales bacterium]
MQKDVAKDTIIKKWGKNRLNYFHQFAGIGWIIGKNDSKKIDLNNIKSINAFYGIKYKLKINQYYAMGFSLEYDIYSYYIKKNDSVVFPDNSKNKIEKFNFNALEFTYYNRLNIKKRGNHIGNYLDIGIFGDLNYKSKHIKKYTDSNDDVNYKIASYNYGFINKYNYGLLVNIGFNRYVVFCKYRLSDLFQTPHYKYPELSRFSAGIQINIF